MLLIEKNKIYIRNYIEIVNMDSCCFQVKMDNYYLIVLGEKLEIYYYDHQEVRLNGHVKVIEYHENRV